MLRHRSDSRLRPKRDEADRIDLTGGGEGSCAILAWRGNALQNLLSCRDELLQRRRVAALSYFERGDENSSVVRLVAWRDLYNARRERHNMPQCAARG